MGIVIGIRSGVKGRFSEQSWPIAVAAGWELVTDSNDVPEPPVEVISFLKDVRANEIQAETVEIIPPEIEDEITEEEIAEDNHTKTVKAAIRPRGRKPKK